MKERIRSTTILSWLAAAVLVCAVLFCCAEVCCAAETESYIQSHLAYAGCEQELFTARAIDEIFRVSAGTMRMINRVCEKVLMYGYQQRRRLIDDQDIIFVSEHEMLKGGES